uniref:exodeoxyribonuclease III n=1 Tax=Lygus hesperus TaxID=30085 RepID=A0A0A9YJM4_LYGHE
MPTQHEVTPTQLEQGRRIAAELPTKRSGDVSIVTWNVAGLRACIKKHFVDIVQSWQDTPEIIALQEIKTSIADVRDALRTLLEGQNYKLICNSGRIPGYSGVAILHKLSFAPIRVALDGALFDRDGYTSLTGTSDLTPEVCREEFWKMVTQEGRMITAEFTNFFLITTYVPNSGEKLELLRFRQCVWEPCMAEYLMNLHQRKPVVLCGDLNVAATEYDVHSPDK